MRSSWNRLLYWTLFPCVTIQKNVWGCQSGLRTNEFPSPNLNSSVNVVTIGQNVSLFCSNKNTPPRSINYSLFLGKNHLKTEAVNGTPMIFQLIISSAHDAGPYKCKAQVLNCSKYSQPFNFTIEEKDGLPSYLLPLCLLLGLLLISLILCFWIRPKYKERKALRENGPKDSGEKIMESQLYENLYKNQAVQLQEIHYMTPVFQEVASKELGTVQPQELDYMTLSSRRWHPRN